MHSVRQNYKTTEENRSGTFVKFVYFSYGDVKTNQWRVMDVLLKSMIICRLFEQETICSDKFELYTDIHTKMPDEGQKTSRNTNRNNERLF